VCENQLYNKKLQILVWSKINFESIINFTRQQQKIY